MFVSVRRALFLVLALLVTSAVFADERERDHGPGPDKERGFGANGQTPNGLPPEECLQFSCDSLPSSVTRDNVGQLAEAWRVTLSATARAPAGGRVVAVNARNGSIVWMTDPPDGQRWTTSSPAIDPSREYVYAYGLDG